jgi:hypothetical protein
MILHIVLVKPRADLSAGDRQAFVKAFKAALSEIPSVQSVRLGTRVRHGAGYEHDMPDAADFMAIIEFKDLSGLQTYLTHPTHHDLGKAFGESLSASLVYDFDASEGLDLLDSLSVTSHV